jgi:hypothetical protein
LQRNRTQKFENRPLGRTILLRFLFNDFQDYPTARFELTDHAKLELNGPSYQPFGSQRLSGADKLGRKIPALNLLRLETQ